MDKKKKYRILSASLLPVFAGMGALSFFSFQKSLNKTSLAIILATIICFSIASGCIENIRIKKYGTQQRPFEFVLMQLVLFIWMNISIALLMEIFNQRIF
jgi:phosphatidylserine synthase